MQVSSNGRVRRTADEWRTLITRFAASGQSRRAFCRQEGINLTSFSRWQSRLAESDPSRFVDVTPAARSTSVWAVEVELSGGTILRLRG